MLETWLEAVRTVPYGGRPPRILHGNWDVTLDGVIEFFARQPHNENRRKLLRATIDLYNLLHDQSK